MVLGLEVVVARLRKRLKGRLVLALDLLEGRDRDKPSEAVSVVLVTLVDWLADVQGCSVVAGWDQVRELVDKGHEASI